jgi:hypothetical protein
MCTMASKLDSGVRLDRSRSSQWYSEAVASPSTDGADAKVSGGKGESRRGRADGAPGSRRGRRSFRAALLAVLKTAVLGFDESWGGGRVPNFVDVSASGALTVASPRGRRDVRMRLPRESRQRNSDRAVDSRAHAPG